MSDKEDMNYVLDTIENEGLGYAVQHYLPASHIADPILADMWDAASSLLDAIEAYVEKWSVPSNERDAG